MTSYRLHELFFGESNLLFSYIKLVSQVTQDYTRIIRVDGEADTILSKFLNGMVIKCS